MPHARSIPDGLQVEVLPIGGSLVTGQALGGYVHGHVAAHAEESLGFHHGRHCGVNGHLPSLHVVGKSMVANRTERGRQFDILQIGATIKCRQPYFRNPLGQLQGLQLVAVIESPVANACQRPFPSELDGGQAATIFKRPVAHLHEAGGQRDGRKCRAPLERPVACLPTAR